MSVSSTKRDRETERPKFPVEQCYSVFCQECWVQDSRGLLAADHACFCLSLCLWWGFDEIRDELDRLKSLLSKEEEESAQLHQVHQGSTNAIAWP